MIGTVALVYGLLVAQAAAFVAIGVVVARLVGARVTGVAIGTPALVEPRAAAPKVTLGPFPSGYLELHGRGPDDPETDDADDWRHLGLARRLLVVIGPWAVIFALAAACLGPAHALRSLSHGISQVLLTVDVTPLLRRFLDLAAAAPLLTTLGILLAKLTAVNLLPLGGFAGASIVRELLGPRPPRWYLIWSMATMLVAMLWITGRFGWAVVQVIVHS